MTRQTQGLLMAFLGAVLVRIALDDSYLRYVTAWMKWPLVATGVVLLALGLGVVVTAARTGPDPERPVDEHAEGGPADGSHGDGVPLVTWLLVLPGLMVFVVSPPQLGSYLAERRADEVVSAPQPAAVQDLRSAGTVPVDLLEFVWRAQDGGGSMAGQSVAVKGFVSYDDEGAWYVTQMSIGCCAADALAYRVQVEGAKAPPRDQWVEVTGVHVAGTGTESGEVPALAATAVKEIAAPEQTYG